MFEGLPGDVHEGQGRQRSGSRATQKALPVLPRHRRRRPPTPLQMENPSRFLWNWPKIVRTRGAYDRRSAGRNRVSDSCFPLRFRRKNFRRLVHENSKTPNLSASRRPSTLRWRTTTPRQWARREPATHPSTRSRPFTKSCSPKPRTKNGGGRSARPPPQKELGS